MKNNDNKRIYIEGYNIHINLDNIEKKKSYLTKMQKTLAIISLTAIASQIPVMYTMYNEYVKEQKKEDAKKVNTYKVDKKFNGKYVSSKEISDVKLTLKK